MMMTARSVSALRHIALKFEPTNNNPDREISVKVDDSRGRGASSSAVVVPVAVLSVPQGLVT